MTATTELKSDAANPPLVGPRPQREAWVSLIAGYCLSVGGFAVLWQIGEFILADSNTVALFRYYFTKDEGFHWRSSWSFVEPLGFVWSHVQQIIYLICGALLWFRRHNSRQLATIVLITTLVSFLITLGTFLEVQYSYPSPFASRVFYGFWHLSQIVMSCVLIGLVRAERPNEDRWRWILASWFLAIGLGELFLVLATCVDRSEMAIVFRDQDWHTISWTTMRPIHFALQVIWSLVATACGWHLVHKSSRLRLIGWSSGAIRTLSEPALVLTFGPIATMGWPMVSKAALDSAIVAIPLLIFLYHQACRLESDNSFCRHCGYDLTGITSGRCPECGTTMTAQSTLGASNGSRCE